MNESGEVYFKSLMKEPVNQFHLGRNVKHDPRSRNFPFRSSLQLSEVEDVEIEWDVAIPPLDQMSLGSCTGNAGTADEATNALEYVGGTNDPLSRAPLDEDYAIALYSEATAIDDYQGTYPPNDTGSDGLSIAKALKSRGLITSYEHIFSLSTAILAIHHGPFITGINWYEGMFDPDPRGVVTISGRIAGGHEPTVIGRKKYFISQGDSLFYWKLRNSWGSSWGDSGNFYMSDATYERLLSEDGDATVLSWISNPAPAPPEPPEPPPFFFQLDPQVDYRVARASIKAHVSPQEWINRHFHHYFGIK